MSDVNPLDHLAKHSGPNESGGEQVTFSSAALQNLQTTPLQAARVRSSTLRQLFKCCFDGFDSILGLIKQQ